MKIVFRDIVGYSHLKIESSYVTRVREIDMIREIRLSLTAKTLPRLLQPLVKCKICKRKATSYFATSTGGFILFCEPCFETFSVFYKHEIRHREEQGIILEDELEITQKALGSRTKRK